MKRIFLVLFICSGAFLLYSMDSGAAWDFNFKTSARAPKAAPSVKEAAPAAARQEADAGYTDYDGFSNVDDPLYREGSKSLLQKAVEGDKKTRSKGTTFKRTPMRDAPAALPPGPAITQPASDTRITAPARKNRLIKMVPADPLKTQSGL